MRLWAIGFACVLVLCGTVQSFGQQSGPATLERLLNIDDAQAPAAAKDVDAGPKRPAGTVSRPKDGVQHPDLDKAWADYDAAVVKVTDSIKATIGKRFDAATAKGDLDTAERWQVIGEKFEKTGELPAESETIAAVRSAASEYKKATEELTKAYEAVVKALTTDKRIADAKATREEKNALEQIVKAVPQPVEAPKDKAKGLEEPDDLRQQATMSLQKAKALSARLLSLSEKEWRLLPGAVFTVSANPNNQCDTDIILTTDDRCCFLPCPTDRWNTSPSRWQAVDFRGHDKDERASNGMPYMRLCYTLDNAPPRYVLETPIITGTQGSLRFVPSDIVGGGRNNNIGSVRVKVIFLRE